MPSAERRSPLSICGQEIRRRDPVEQRTIALQQFMHAAVVFRPQVDAEVGTELARMDDDLIPNWLPFGIVAFNAISMSS